MHRELSHADDLFERPRSAGLSLLTAALAILLLADLGPPLANWLSSQFGMGIPFWTTREIAGFRFAQIAAVLGGLRILFASLERLAEGKVGADLATAIACFAALAMNEPVVAAEVVVIGLIGECLEVWTFGRARRGVERLAEVFPIRCWRLIDGKEERVPTSELKAGDIVVVKPGGKIPVDGIVLAGQSTVDASALTGESLPQDRGPGQMVLAGSVNQFGSLTIEARKVARATVAGQVVEQTAKALKNKAGVEREADKMARWFLPAVLSLAFVVFAFHYFRLGGSRQTDALRQSLYPALAVLVVACPCALLLATPTAMVAAVGRLAGTGILVKGGAVFEKLAKVDSLAFDKTGTLTEAKLEVAAIDAFAEFDAKELLRLAAGVERFSEHPLARCILNEAAKRQIGVPEAADFRAKPGAGATAIVEGRQVRVGNGRMMEEAGVAISEKADAAWAASDAAGATLLLIALEERIVGSIALRDRIRPEAADVLAELRNGGISSMAMLTGDRAAVAQTVADELRIDRVHAELMPSQKADWLKQNPSCAFVGDGINDAPAIAQAFVGMAIRSPQSDAPSDVGDVVFLGEPLAHLPLLMRLSRETLKVIRQNILVFAFGFNLAGVLLVGLLWPLFFGQGELADKSPLVGVIYHQFGSLAVLLNSLRLLIFERRSKASAGWAKVRLALQDFDGWFDLDRLLHEASHRWKPIGLGLASFGILLWAISGITQIEADEVGILKRFGSIRAELSPGLHIRYPWPVEETVKLKPGAVHSIDVGFLAVADRTDSQRSWQSDHHGDIRKVPGESLMLTGDGNLVDLSATVRYSIDDPAKYLNASQNADALIHLTFESLLRERLAGEAFLDLLTIRRGPLADELQMQLRQRLAAVHPEGLGVKLVAIVLPDLHPPPEVVPAYHEVAQAIQQRDLQINRGLAEAIRIRRGAEQDALQLRMTAEATANERIRQAEASRDVFQAWLEHRGELTEFRLALEAVTAFLKSRDKVLIDADKVPGKRNLLLVDPEMFKSLQMGPPKPP